MKALLKKISLALSSVVMMSGLTFAIAAVPAHAQVTCDSGVGAGVAATDPNGQCTEDGGGSTFTSLIQTIINVFSIVVGAVSVIMIIIGGFRYIVSNGDSGSVGGAKNTILYAIVGLVIVFFAQVIVRFVLTQLGNAGN